LNDIPELMPDLLSLLLSKRAAKRICRDSVVELLLDDSVSEDVKVRLRAYRKFKPHFPLSATVSPPRVAVKRAVSGEDSPLSMRINPLNRAELPPFDAPCPPATGAQAVRDARPPLQGRSGPPGDQAA